MSLSRFFPSSFPWLPPAAASLLPRRLSRLSREGAVEPEAPPPPYYVYVTNETSGDLTVIAGGTHEVVATVPLGKRPRGIKGEP